MNFQALADTFFAPTGILSVEKTADGGCGTIRIVAGNKKYIDPIIHPPGPVPPGIGFVEHAEFQPNTPYEMYLPKDKGFEELCYRGAVLREPVHTYVHLNALGVWFDIFVLPLDCCDGDVCYCAYTAIPCSAADIGLTSSNSNSTSEDVLKTCIKLHEAKDFRLTLNEVINDIRFFCRAESCVILLRSGVDNDTYVLASDVAENTSLKHMSHFSNFNELVASWEGMIGTSDCVIIKNEEDMDYFSRVNNPWYLSLVEAGIKTIILFPLRHDNEILGYLWATNFDTNNTMRIKEAMELMTFFISSKIATHRMMERLKKISYSDVLTELPSRFACADKIAELVKKGERFITVSIDINHFKSINDTLGFESGNQVLIRIAKRWKKITESRLTTTQNYIARISGDEFALIIRDYRSEEDVLHTIKQYETALEKRLTVDECDLHMTAAFGYAEFPVDADGADSIMSCANAAMREVKRANSSNHILRFYAELLKSEHILVIESKIRAALENDTIFFNLQPQFDMEHKLRGFEALARMRDDNGGVISPGEFIPVAEKVGLIDKVDGAVFRKAMLFFGELLRKTDEKLILSVNASVRHLMKNDFLDEIRELLAESGVPAECLEIEITESIMIDSAEKALQCISELRKMGVKLAIDDFGTGYSALSYLNNFPANLLKIDKSFVDKMNTSESSRQYVAAIISMGHIMGFDVIAEGVEEEEQLRTLKEIGCDFIQGFIWGRPLMPDDAAKLTDNTGGCY